MHDNSNIPQKTQNSILSQKFDLEINEDILEQQLSEKDLDSDVDEQNSQTYRSKYNLIKRGIDVCASILFIIITLPIVAVIAVLIKATSKGPVIYKHRRIGKLGVEFDCWKFRTMVSNADEVLRENPQLQKEFKKNFKIENDPRITKIGRFLRSTSLDELPQLVQVLQGKMTLVGPRPIVRRELDKYSIYQDKLLSVKPGLSGLWQVSGRSKTTYKKRVLLDMEYIDKRSLSLDMFILVLTVSAVLKRKGAS